MEEATLFLGDGCAIREGQGQGEEKGGPVHPEEEAAFFF